MHVPATAGFCRRSLVSVHPGASARALSCVHVCASALADLFVFSLRVLLLLFFCGQDLDAGVIVGVGNGRTYGKGLVQNVAELPYNNALKYTVAKYYTPSGRWVAGRYRMHLHVFVASCLLAWWCVGVLYFLSCAAGWHGTCPWQH